MTFARGIDISGDYQLPAKMHFDKWVDLGFCYGWVEWTNGTRLVPHASEHRQLMLASNYLTGGYANLRPDDKSPEEQCDKFLDNCPWDGFVDMLDAELNLAESMVRAWVNRYRSRTSNRLLVIYTGKGVWERIVPTNARQFYADLFDVVVGSYPFDTPPTWDPVSKTYKDIQPMDSASVARRSNPPPGYTPPLPLNWTADKLFSHQHSGHASLPEYDGFLDTHVSRLTQAQLRARFAGVPVAQKTIQSSVFSAQAHDSAILDLLK